MPRNLNLALFPFFKCITACCASMIVAVAIINCFLATFICTSIKNIDNILFIILCIVYYYSYIVTYTPHILYNIQLL